MPWPNCSSEPGAGVIMHLLSKLRRSAKGATAVEYGLIVALIVIVGMMALFTLADTTISMWNGIAENVLAN